MGGRALIPMPKKQEFDKLPTPRDGKDSFYRKLQLDDSTMKLIKNYRSIKQMIDKDMTVKTDA